MASVLSSALRKVITALQGCGFPAAVIGDVAHLSWGFTDQPVWGIEIIVSIGEEKRESFLSAARGEGLYLASSSSSSLSLRHIDKKLGTSADVELILETRENVLRIPTPALLEGNRVLVVENGRLVEKKLEIGLKNWDWTEIRAGLSPGAQVVTSLDRPEVKAGAEVRITRGTPGEDEEKAP